MKKILALLVGLLVSAAVPAVAQMLTPITWETSVKMTSDTEGQVVMAATIDAGWHLYALEMPDDGPSATKVEFSTLKGVELVGKVTPSRPAPETYDEVFGLNLGWWEKSVTFTQKFKTVKGYSGAREIAGEISFQGCNDESCIPPTREYFEFRLGAAAGTEQAAPETAVEAETADSVATVLAVDVPAAKADESGWWTPVNFPEQEEQTSGSWWYIFIWGFIGGLVALLTPCVWPMIPLTVSFFLKKSGSRRKAVRDALVYGGSIVVIYLVLGLAITLIFGASKLNDLSTNAVFNLMFFLLLLVFAISFFGAFDIKLPSRWSNGVDSKAEATTGLLSIFFMAFTLVLVSFSCTGPIIGTLLVEAASVGDITGPAIGMGAFALALAIPFSLFAMFPTLLKEMPKSGGWLNSVKVVLGFLELALSLKFLSVADLAYGWGILDREVFVSLWVVIFGLLGMYLLGKLNFSHDTPSDRVGVTRFFLALVSLSFMVYLIPGLWGAPLKSVSAFVPPLYTQDFNLYAGGEFKEFDNYDEAMRYGAENNRPVLVDFSGYGCVNCRKMEGAVFDTPEVSAIIRENFVLVKLMVDDKKELPEPVVVEENGRKVRLVTVGDKWSYLQRSKFGANSQPYYVMLDAEGNALNGPAYYDENVAAFIEWLDKGIAAYAAANAR